ncbi:DUF6323 family protein [Tissierella sp. MB52-C2]|uniref:DUF6323 family protein n=1 Tax=Tissierella sp. MB52-C2 TaxID=3070999 RepID=UPI00280B08D9|nr:DUF6323 family protein [Tissierella sp. MB52-C2]WMM23401.1 DUF6323 family protein [Tissierella sp. MB52-C2]
MLFGITSLGSSLILKQAVTEIERYNDFTAQFRLTLSHHDAVELVETRALALKTNGRIEFGVCAGCHMKMDTMQKGQVLIYYSCRYA